MHTIRRNQVEVDAQKMVVIEMPKRMRADKIVPVKIAGLRAGERVTVTATCAGYCINAKIKKYSAEAQWHSKAVYRADGEGTVDLSCACSLGGSYRGVDPMGLFTSMTAKKCKRAPEKVLDKIPEYRETCVSLQVSRRGKALARGSVVRTFAGEDIKSLDVGAETYVGRFFYRDDGIKRPAVVVLSGSDGRIEKAQAIAELLSEVGYAALAVAYFGLQPLPMDLCEIPLETVTEAVTWLKKNPAVDGGKIAVYGRSKGGEMALAAAVGVKEISCIAAVVPSCYCLEGLKGGFFPTSRSSWTYDDKPMSFLKAPWYLLVGLAFKMLFGKANALVWLHRKMLPPRGEDCAAAIDVQKIPCPILFISSRLDGMWPSEIYALRAKKRRANAGVGNCDEYLSYPHAGHMITVPYQSIPTLKGYGGRKKEWKRANADAWERTLAFLAKHLTQ